MKYSLLAASCAVTILSFASFSFGAQPQGRGDAAIEEDPLQHPLPPGIRLRAFIHRPRVVEPNHLGTCTSTANDTIGDYLLAGWHLPTTGITWKLNESMVPANIGAAAARTAITDSFSAWSKVDSGKIFSDGGKTTIKAAKFDGTNAILWKHLSPSTIAVTYVWYYTATGEVAEVDTVFNSRFPWAIFDPSLGDECQTSSASPDAYDVQDIATHELGHWLGLDDLYDDQDKDLTMYGFGAGGELKKRTLGLGDDTGANAVAP